jgi:hypothetical protein
MHGMLATIGFRILRVPVSYLKEIKIQETVILRAVLYACESLSVALSEENRLRVLRSVFVSKRRLDKIS